MLPPRRIPWMASVFVAVTTLTWAQARAGSLTDRDLVPPRALGLRTDRLSPTQQERWQSIIQVALAEDTAGQPLHPTLAHMWDAVAASRHEVYVELSEPGDTRCCQGGFFRVESVAPDGHIVAVLRLNLETIDRAVIDDEATHGFRRFHGLGREGRYAEVLGHELGHAVWTLAEPSRAHRALALRREPPQLARALLGAGPDERAEIERRLTELGTQVRAQEAPAWAAEALVWEELQAARSAQR